MAELPPNGGMTKILWDLERLQVIAETADDAERTRMAAITALLQRRLLELDFTRRFDLSDAPPVETSFFRRLWPRLATLLTSRGFMRDSELPARFLSYAGTAVMWLSLVGMSGSVLRPHIDTRVAHAWDLAVSADQAEAKQSWEQARERSAQSPPPSPLSPSISATTLAHSFLNAYLSSSAWHMASDTVVREGILRAAMLRDHVVRGQAANIHASAEGPPNPLDPIFLAAEAIASDPSGSNQLEERLTRKVEEEVPPSFRARFAGKWTAFTAAYAEPAEPSELVRAVLGEVLDPAFEALQPDGARTAVKEVAKVVAKGLKTMVERSIDTQFDRYLTELSGDVSPETAMSHVAQASAGAADLTPGNATEINVFSRRMEDLIATAATEAATRHTAFVRSDPVPADMREIERLASLVVHGEASPKMDYLASYGDYFANSKDEAAKTVRAQALADTRHALAETEFADAAARARDFEKLSRSNLVGGVLIGRKASDTDRGLDGISLHWDVVHDGRIVLIVTNAAGGETRLGPYSPDVMYRALLFAADGRPLVVTVINTGLIGSQKVILHPALVDSRIGCEMLDLDEFVFRYLDKSLVSRHSADLKQVEAYQALYNFALLHVERSLSKRGLPMRDEAEIIDNINLVPVSALSNAITDKMIFTEPEWSPLAARNHIYSDELLLAMQTCLDGHNTSLDEFGECIEAIATRRIHFRSDIDAWLVKPKPLEFVSGVRDRPFSIDSKLSFLQSGLAKENTLEFLIQDTNGSGDQDVWQFKALAPSIAAGVSQLVARDTTARAILSDADDFSVLQRLFRTIFDGILRGDRLPQEMTQLADELHVRSNDTLATARWTAAGPSPAAVGVRELKAWHEKIPTFPTTQPYSLAVSAGLQWLEGCVRSGFGTGPAAAAAWQSNCSLVDPRPELQTECTQAADNTSVPCRIIHAAEFADSISTQIKLSEALGVTKGMSEERDSPRTCRTEP